MVVAKGPNQLTLDSEVLGLTLATPVHFPVESAIQKFVSAQKENGRKNYFSNLSLSGLCGKFFLI